MLDGFIIIFQDLVLPELEELEDTPEVKPLRSKQPSTNTQGQLVVDAQIALSDTTVKDSRKKHTHFTRVKVCTTQLS